MSNATTATRKARNMPTRTRRILRRTRSYLDVIWIAGIVVWMVYIVWTQRPWQGPDQLQTSEWLLVGICGILVGSLQRRGKDYWPANALLGLAVGVVPVLYFVFTTVIFQGDVEALRLFALRTNMAVFAWMFCLLLLAWALFLVIRVNTAREGSSLDLWGQVRPPTRSQTREALSVISRSARHDRGNLIMQPEFANLRAFVRQTEEQGAFLRDPQQQLRYERDLAERRIAAAEARVRAVDALGVETADRQE